MVVWPRKSAISLLPDGFDRQSSYKGTAFHHLSNQRVLSCATVALAFAARVALIFLTPCADLWPPSCLHAFMYALPNDFLGMLFPQHINTGSLNGKTSNVSLKTCDARKRTTALKPIFILIKFIRLINLVLRKGKYFSSQAAKFLDEQLKNESDFQFSVQGQKQRKRTLKLLFLMKLPPQKWSRLRWLRMPLAPK